MKKLLIIILLVIIHHNLSAQKNSIKIGEDLIYNQNFDNAISFYKKLIAMDPYNPEYQYKLGFCYLNTIAKRDSSITPIKNSLQIYKKLRKKQKKQTNYNPLEAKFYLARAYRVNFIYDTALTLLGELKNKITHEKSLKLIENEQKLCIDGLKLYAKPINIQIENLGNKINTEYTEHTPLFSSDETMLIFTSRKKLFNDAELNYDNEYDENIYIATKDSLGKWTTPKPITEINTHDHEATVSLSYDATKLFIYKPEADGTIYMSKFKNEHWQPPEKLNSKINTRNRETHASISYDGKTLYFTSDRNGGYGGLDIYYSKLTKKGTWGRPVNLGPGINTPKDEEAPYILPDNKTLYFSSKGHGGLGGFDIFKTTINDFGTWSYPTNLGYPINSIDDDVFFFPTPDQQRAYFASKKNDDNYGKSDIYIMTFPKIQNSPLVIISAKLIIKTEKTPNLKITLTDTNNKEKFIATPKNGKFIFVTKKGHKYKLNIRNKKKQLYSQIIEIPENAPRIIKIDPIEINIKKTEPIENITKITAKDSKISENIQHPELPKNMLPTGETFDTFVEINNMLFPTNKVGEIKKNSTLDTLANFLKRNPNAIIEIRGYCDASGKATYNYILGLKRAKAVQKYLMKKNINKKQLKITSYGEENPIAINKNPDGTWNKNGQKLNRRVEFKIIKNGKETILIWSMKIPEKLKNPNYKINYKKAKSNDIETKT